MKTRLTLIMCLGFVTNLFASTGAEQAKMIVVALGSVVVVIVASVIRKKKDN